MYIKSKRGGEFCETTGEYCCLYHQKNKIKIRAGTVFNNCNYQGKPCEGPWHFLKAVVVKTHDEIAANHEWKRMKKYMRRGVDKDYLKQLKGPGYNKWDFEKW